MKAQTLTYLALALFITGTALAETEIKKIHTSDLHGKVIPFELENDIKLSRSLAPNDNDQIEFFTYLGFYDDRPEARLPESLLTPEEREKRNLPLEDKDKKFFSRRLPFGHQCKISFMASAETRPSKAALKSAKNGGSYKLVFIGKEEDKKQSLLSRATGGKSYLEKFEIHGPIAKAEMVCYDYANRKSAKNGENHTSHLNTISQDTALIFSKLGIKDLPEPRGYERQNSSSSSSSSSHSGSSSVQANQ